MFWKLSLETAGAPVPETTDGRFVLHRHHDDLGPHLDLRLEEDGYLTGWRIDAESLDRDAWAAEKMPHPMRWIDHDGDAIREDEGTYAWIDRRETVRRILLRGRDGACVLTAERAPIAPHALRCMLDALDQCNAAAHDAPHLIRDGIAARQRAIARLCGLGRELDGDGFDDSIWRKALASLSLDDIHQQLRTFERRFDAAYPPAPVSQPEPLQCYTNARTEGALAIARSA